MFEHHADDDHPTTPVPPPPPIDRDVSGAAFRRTLEGVGLRFTDYDGRWKTIDAKRAFRAELIDGERCWVRVPIEGLHLLPAEGEGRDAFRLRVAEHLAEREARARKTAAGWAVAAVREVVGLGLEEAAKRLGISEGELLAVEDGAVSDESRVLRWAACSYGVDRGALRQLFERAVHAMVALDVVGARLGDLVVEAFGGRS